MTRTDSLPMREAGRLITFPVTDPQDQLPDAGIPAWARPHLPPSYAATAEFLIVDVIAEHDPQRNAEFARHRDTGLANTLLAQLSSVEALEREIAARCSDGYLAPQKSQQRIALFAQRTQSLPRAARVFTRNHPDVAG